MDLSLNLPASTVERALPAGSQPLFCLCSTGSRSALRAVALTQAPTLRRPLPIPSRQERSCRGRSVPPPSPELAHGRRYRRGPRGTHGRTHARTYGRRHARRRARRRWRVRAQHVSAWASWRSGGPCPATCSRSCSPSCVRAAARAPRAPSPGRRRR